MTKHKNSKPSKKSGSKDYFISPVVIKLFFAVIILVIFGNSLSFDFTLDDDLFVKNHPLVQKGISKIPETFTHGSMEHFKGSNFQIYRPVLISAFCIEKELFGNKPTGFHFINLLLYFLIIVTLFKLLRSLFAQWHLYFVSIICVIFLVHPAHVEVVASIKSQDELLAAFFCLLSLFYASRYISNANNSDLIKAIASYLPALFCKESTVAFAAIFPLTFFLLQNRSIKDSLIRSIPFFTAAGFFVFVRYFVLKNIYQGNETTIVENVLYGAHTIQEQLATRASILFQYIQVMLWPMHLSWDYSYNQIPVTGWSMIPVLSIIVYALLLFAAIFYFKKEKAVTFGILFFLILITPTANIFFLNGTTFAGRFVFLPSAGLIIALFFLVLDLTKIRMTVNSQKSNGFRLAVLFVVIAFSSLSLNASNDWKNNLSLFESGVKHAPNSSRTNSGLATEYMNMAEKAMDPATRAKYVDLAEKYFLKSLEIYPGNSNAAYKLGLIYALQNDTPNAISYYKQSIDSKPDYSFALNNLGAIYAAQKQLDSAEYYFKKSIATDSSNGMTLTNLTVISFLKGNDDAAIEFGTKAIETGSGSEKVYSLLAQAYQRKGNSAESERYRQLIK